MEYVYIKIYAIKRYAVPFRCTSMLYIYEFLFHGILIDKSRGAISIFCLPVTPMWVQYNCIGWIIDRIRIYLLLLILVPLLILHLDKLCKMKNAYDK